MASLTVAVYVDGKFRARKKVCPDMAEGINRIGDKASLIKVGAYAGKPEADVAVFYGLRGVLKTIMADYKAAGLKAIYIDLGYWKRNWNGDRYGFHRFSINDRHPTAYFQQAKHPPDRANAIGIRIEPWRKGGEHILLCGMSQKCAEFEGYKFEQWERDAVKKIRAVTDRPIWYRPKPNKHGAYAPIDGTTFRPSRRLSDITDALTDAWAIVSHHSNAGIDAIVHGVPCFSEEGVAVPMGLSDLISIEQRHYPTDDERRAWVNDVAYCQFNRQEMRDGTAWRHFKNEGLV